MSTSTGLLTTLLSLWLLAWPLRTASAGPPQVEPETEKCRLIDSLFEFASARLSPGAAVVVMRDGKAIHKKGYGLANLEHTIPITSDSAFRIGSLTKPFTAAAVLKMHEQGLLDINEPVANYLPEVPAAGGITIRHILSHTSGIVDFRLRAPVFEPGRRMKYSNTGYVLLGRLIEKVSGRSYDRFLADNIFGPLNMTNTGYDYPRRIVRNRASGYFPAPGGRFVNESCMDMAAAFSAGGLYSTIEDLCLFDRALSDEKLLKRETLELAFTPATLKDGRQIDYGLGWMIHDYRGLSEIAHGGGIGGFNAFFARYPDRKLTVIVLANTPLDAAPDIPTAADLAHQIADICLFDSRPDIRKLPLLSRESAHP